MRVGQALASERTPTWPRSPPISPPISPPSRTRGPRPAAAAVVVPVRAWPGNATVRKGACVIAVTTAITVSAWAGTLLTQTDNEVVATLLLGRHLHVVRGNCAR